MIVRFAWWIVKRIWGLGVLQKPVGQEALGRIWETGDSIQAGAMQFRPIAPAGEGADESEECVGVIFAESIEGWGMGCGGGGGVVRSRLWCEENAIGLESRVGFAEERADGAHTAFIEELAPERRCIWLIGEDPPEAIGQLI